MTCPCCLPDSDAPHLRHRDVRGTSWTALCLACAWYVHRVSACPHQLAREARRPGLAGVRLHWQTVRTLGEAA